MAASHDALKIKTLERLIKERFRSYDRTIEESYRLTDTRFKAADVAVTAALAAQEKAVSAAFSASEKAILKAEHAQKEYNERSNEFRGQLDDQAKTLMPRPETLAMFKSLEDKLNTLQTVLDSKLQNVQITAKNELDASKSSFDKIIFAIDGHIANLRESRSEHGGAAQARGESITQKNWSLGIIVSVIFGILGFAIAVGVALHKP